MFRTKICGSEKACTVNAPGRVVFALHLMWTHPISLFRISLNKIEGPAQSDIHKMNTPSNRSKPSLRSKESSTFAPFNASEQTFELQLGAYQGGPYQGSEAKLPLENVELVNDEATSTPVYPQRWTLWMIMVALALTVFCVALDNTIISTAIPSITDQFHSLDDVGWYGSVYLLTTCGKLYLSLWWFDHLLTPCSPSTTVWKAVLHVLIEEGLPSGSLNIRSRIPNLWSRA